MKKYPSIHFVLDIHRDAIEDSDGNTYKVISDVNGKNAAQLSIVVGGDGSGLPHGHWQENLKLAVLLQQNLLEDYPTLMRPMYLRNSRYNEHATTGSLLVEVGLPEIRWTRRSMPRACLPKTWWKCCRHCADAAVRALFLPNTGISCTIGSGIADTKEKEKRAMKMRKLTALVLSAALAFRGCAPWRRRPSI